MVGLILPAFLGVAVVAEGAYIAHTRKQLNELGEKIDRLSAPLASPAGGGGLAEALGSGGGDLDEDSSARSGTARRAAPPPRFVPQVGSAATAAATAGSAAGGELPLPTGFETPEAREQLRQFVRAQMELERAERRRRDEQERDQRAQEARDKLAKDLGLSSAESEKFNQLLTSAQNGRRDLGEQIRSGKMSRQEIGQAFDNLRQKTEQEMKSLLGEDRMKKFQELTRGGRDRRGGPGGPGGGGPPGGGGERWGGGGGWRRGGAAPGGQGAPAAPGTAGAAPAAAPAPAAQ